MVKRHLHYILNSKTVTAQLCRIDSWGHQSAWTCSSRWDSAPPLAVVILCTEHWDGCSSNRLHQWLSTVDQWVVSALPAATYGSWMTLPALAYKDKCNSVSIRPWPRSHSTRTGSSHAVTSFTRQGRDILDRTVNLLTIHSLVRCNTFYLPFLFLFFSKSHSMLESAEGRNTVFRVPPI